MQVGARHGAGMSALLDRGGEVLARFGDLDGRLVAGALALHVANHGLRSLAWRNVLASAYPARRIPFLVVMSAYALGVALNAVLPARGGDAVKIAVVRARVEGSKVATIAASMSVITLFDLVAATVLVLGVCLTGSLAVAPQPPELGAATWVGLAAVVLAVAGAGIALGRARLRALWSDVRVGGAILRTPSRYAVGVALVQAGAWLCRIGVVLCLLAAFGLHADPLVAATVMVLCGVSTLVPLTPGGAGTQQVMLAYALSQTATATAIVSFSIGMQAGITAVNALLGLAGAMLAFRTLCPMAAARSALRLARA
jgi:uncharacterized membrane protein YbhN (UPF0104 family)